VIAYVDASVAVRVIMKASTALAEWPEIQRGISSVLMRAECCRALDRLARTGEITDAEYDNQLVDLDELLATMILFDIDTPVLRAASRRFGVRIDTLDAIHLATAEQFRAGIVAGSLVFATHDKDLAAAARHVGFEVIGSPLESPS
jgi:predicted nucleic acid-binding protein